MAKLVWRVKLVTEMQAGVTTEVEVGCFERDEQASVADLGLRLEEAAWFRKCHLQVAPEIARVLIAKGFADLSVTLI